MALTKSCGVTAPLATDAAAFRLALASLEETQRATINVLEDFESEKSRLEEAQRASFNILEDFEAEGARSREVQQATFNILEDFEREKARSEETQRGTFNILEDFEFEKSRAEETQRATYNVLEDFEIEKARLEDAQRASLNILEDLDIERVRVGRTERELADRAQELSRSNEELDAFAYSVSHDLRAPLRSMDGFSRMLLEESGAILSPEGRHYVDTIIASAGEMGNLVDDLLAFSRLGKQPVHRETTEPRILVDQALEELRPLQAERDVRVRISALPPCRADPGLLRQVYANLLSNAIKYTRKRARAEIEVGWSPEGGGVYFVKDNGVGFDLKYASKLFGVFQRLHRAEDYEGTGVGLAIVHRIVTRHGGRVWAESAVDQGATFRFTIPGGPGND